MPIFKATENKKGGGKGGFKTSPKPTLDYITRPDKAAIVTSFYLDDDVDYAMQFADTKKVWNKAQSKSSRKYYHFIHSFSAYDDITPELAHELTEELCRKSFPDSEVVVATHTDTDHMHCHIVIDSVNFTNGKMLQISPKAYTAIKDLSNELALEKGLTPVDFRKPSREPVRQSQAERQIILRGGTSWKQELCEVIDYAKQNAADMEEFQNILAQYGIEITRNTEKTIAYKHPQKSKAIRGEKIGQNYTKEAKLMNYIRFWQASGESEKTSMRIKTRMQQLTAEGSYTGGPVSFGYKLVKNGRLNKRGKEISDLAIDENEVEWVKKIFELTVNNGYGSYRVASFLNEKGVRTHNGAKFQSITIIRILRNKLYCGYIVSGETVSPQMQELQIIDKDMFERAQYILDQRSDANDAEREIVMTTKGRAMLSGLMFCAHCGCRLTSNVFRDTYTRTDGSVRTGEYLRYICYHKSRKLCECDGQSTYTAAKVDDAVCQAVKDIISSETDAPDEVALKRKYDKEMSGHKAKITKLNLEIKRYSTQLEKLNAEIADSLTGDSVYTPEQLSRAINSVNLKISDANAQLETIQNEIENQKAAMEKVRPNYDRFIGWAGEFASATVERKKMIISQLVKRIEISKGYKINIEMNMDYEQFCEGWNGLKEVVTA